LIARSHFLSQCPPEDADLPEIAVFGRSNVGKSSLVNFLANRKLLSTISKHPGHTKLIHHFKVDRSWYLVDLPGIGYAQASKDHLASMDRLVTAFIRLMVNTTMAISIAKWSTYTGAGIVLGLRHQLVDDGVLHLISGNTLF